MSILSTLAKELGGAFVVAATPHIVRAVEKSAPIVVKAVQDKTPEILDAVKDSASNAAGIAKVVGPAAVHAVKSKFKKD